jgi:hypothetical protein
MYKKFSLLFFRRSFNFTCLKLTIRAFVAIKMKQRIYPIHSMMRFLFALFTLFLIPGAAITCLEGVAAMFQNREIWVPLGIGWSSGVFLYVFLIRRWQAFLTFEHELTHALMALLFFRKIHSFVVTGKRGGLVRHSGNFGGPFGDLMITAAPYFLPTFSFVAIWFKPLIPDSWIFWFNLFLGITLMFHLLSAWDEVRNNWRNDFFTNVKGESMRTDIGKLGYAVAFLAITAFTLLFYGMIFHMIVSGYSGLWPFLRSVAVGSRSIWEPLAIWLYHLILQLF